MYLEKNLKLACRGAVPEFYNNLWGVWAKNQVGKGLSYRAARAYICKRFRRPGIDSEDLISPCSMAGRYDK
jgi:hypothetical protein